MARLASLGPPHRIASPRTIKQIRTTRLKAKIRVPPIYPEPYSRQSGRVICSRFKGPQRCGSQTRITHASNLVSRNAGRLGCAIHHPHSVCSIRHTRDRHSVDSDTWPWLHSLRNGRPCSFVSPPWRRTPPLRVIAYFATRNSTDTDIYPAPIGRPGADRQGYRICQSTSISVLARGDQAPKSQNRSHCR